VVVNIGWGEKKLIVHSIFPSLIRDSSLSSRLSSGKNDFDYTVSGGFL